MAFKIKKVRPLFTGVITTATTYKGEMTTAGGLLLDTTKLEGSLNIYQQVVAVGTTVHDVKAGDIVCINYKRYAVPKQTPGSIENNVQSSNLEMTYQIPKIDIDGTDFLFLQANDIEYVIEDYDVDEGGLLQ